MSRIRTVVVLLVVSLLSVAPLAAPVVRAQQATPLAPAASPVAALPAGATVVARGLVNPRGFVWGQDGTLFVGLAGSGGDTPGPQGSPFFGGKTAGIAAVRQGTVTMLASGLPSTNWRAIDWVWGVNSVAILGDQLYALVAGGGAVHGNPETPSGVYAIAADGTATLVADLGAWVDAHPVAQTPPEGAKTNGSFFDVAVVGQALWVTDAVNGQVLQVTPAGEITRIADLSNGHPVPSGIVADPTGGADVGLLTPAPYVAGSAKVIHVAADGTVTDVWTGLTTVTGLALGADGARYVAELSAHIGTAEPFLTPNSGRILRQTGATTGTVVASGLNFPVDLGVGSDGALYVSTPAFGADTGTGQILRLSANAAS